MGGDTDERVRELLAEPWYVSVVREESAAGEELWTAEAPELAVAVRRPSPASALEDLERAMEERLRGAVERGGSVPRPSR